MSKYLILIFLFSSIVSAHVIYDFAEDLQGWTVNGNSAIINHIDGCLVQTYPENPNPWYPIVESPYQTFNADEHSEFAIKVFGYKIPIDGIPCRFFFWRLDNNYGMVYFTVYPGEQIVRFNIPSGVSEGHPYEGTVRTVRLDMPHASQVGYSLLADSEIRIDWLAITNSSTFMAAEEGEQYIIPNLSRNIPVSIPEQVEEVSLLLPNSANSAVKAGASYIVNCLASPESNGIMFLNDFLQAAQENNVPVMIQLDVENWIDGRPDLWNWWDPSENGYDPANKENVEWTDWDSSNAIKVSWRNWGFQLRVKPQINLMSPEYRQAAHDAYDTYIPVILDWWNDLPESKKDLFVGIKVGWESSIGLNSFHYPNGNYYIETWPDDESNDPAYGVSAGNPPAYGVQQIGYAALKTAGIKTSGSITETDLAQITGMHLTDLAQTAYNLGVPRNKLFTHSWPFDAAGTNYLSACNVYSNPGWSRYTNSTNSVRSFEPDIDSAINDSDASYWGLAESWYQGIGTTSNWQSYLENNLGDSRCRYIGLYNWDRIRQNNNILDAIRNMQQPAAAGFSIQDAIDSANDDDTIIIPRGIYYENLDLLGKSITLTSEFPNDWDVVGDTIIDGMGGMVIDADNISGSGATITGLTITNGSADRGGGIYAKNSSQLDINLCIVNNCSANYNGGALYFENVIDVNISNCLLYNNEAVYGGGGIYFKNSLLEMINCTVVNNIANSQGGALRGYSSGWVRLLNSILWNNFSGTGGQIAIRDASAEFDYCNVEAGSSAITLEDGASYEWGLGNIDTDPIFTDSENEAFYLSSSAGATKIFAKGFQTSASTSPCIDKGCPGSSMENEYTDPDNKRINMGYCGNTSEASKTPEGFGLLSDINNNNTVDLMDFGFFSDYWNVSDTLPIPADFDRNGIVDVEDLMFFSPDWLN